MCLNVKIKIRILNFIKRDTDTCSFNKFVNEQPNKREKHVETISKGTYI